MMLKRRQFLKYSTAGGIAIATPLASVGSAIANIPSSQFSTPLKLPPLLEGRKENGKRIFDLTLQSGLSNFLGHTPTPTAGINGTFLGPVVQVQRGDNVKLNVANHLFEPSTLHWHGLNLPAVMDGGPHQVIQPSETWSPEFKIHQSASTQWYHSHMYHRTGIQVYYGLAGLFYIEDKSNEGLNLPSRYGIDDIPLVLQDRSFNQDGTFRYLSSMHDRMSGAMGQFMLTNGTSYPVFKIQKQLTRFRILNGSNARIYNLEFSDQRQFLQIASDGGLLESPVPMTSAILAPGERVEILVEFSINEDVMLQHKPLPKRENSRAGMMAMMQNMMTAADRPFPIIRFESDRSLERSKEISTQLISPRNYSISDVTKNSAIYP